MEVDVSVIVTTKNEEKNIRRCLESIINQSVAVREVIVIDNKSSDKTVDIASHYTNQIYQCGPERSAQRNFGIKNCATGKYVMYLDADMILSPRCIEVCYDQISKDSRCVALFIKEIILGNSFFNRIRRFEREFYDGTPIDAVRFIDRAAFMHVGGFDEQLFERGSGEDWDLDKSLKSLGALKLARLDSRCEDSEAVIAYAEIKSFVSTQVDFDLSQDPIIFHNETELTCRRYLEKKIYYSSGFSGYIRKWGASDPDVKYQFSPINRLCLVFLRNGGFRKVFTHPIYFFCIFGLKILVGIAYLKTWIK